MPKISQEKNIKQEKKLSGFFVCLFENGQLLSSTNP